jgi:hypothetical protein
MLQATGKLGNPLAQIAILGLSQQKKLKDHG